MPFILFRSHLLHTVNPNSTRNTWTTIDNKINNNNRTDNDGDADEHMHEIRTRIHTYVHNAQTYHARLFVSFGVLVTIFIHFISL